MKKQLKFNKKSKVLFIGSYYPTLGGAEKYQYELCLNREEPKKSFILCPNVKGKTPKDPCKIIRAFTLISNKDIVKKLGLLEYIQNYSFIIPAFIKGKNLIKKEGVEVIHVSFGLSFGICGLLLKEYTKTPLVLTLQGSGFNFHGWRKILRPITKKVLENADKIIAVSNAVLDEAKSVANITGEIIYNSVETKDFENKGDENYILAVGRLAKMKGFDILINAAKELTPYKFKILGDGPEREFLTKMITQNNLKNVELLGQTSPKETRRIMSRCSIFIMPSKFGEGLPFALVEAIASGKPVIGTRVRGIPELIERNGILISPNNVYELKEAIEKLMKNPKQRREMGLESKLFAKKNLELNQGMKRLEKIYQTLSVKKYVRED
jgi:glycosyltransferase involved in cell wall biosynthesis